MAPSDFPHLNFSVLSYTSTDTRVGLGGGARTVIATESEAVRLPSETSILKVYVRSELCAAGAVQVVSKADELANVPDPDQVYVRESPSGSDAVASRLTA